MQGNTVSPESFQVDHSAPAFVIKVSHGAVHELIGGPLQGHDVSVLVEGEITWNGLHVVPLQRTQRWNRLH